MNVTVPIQITISVGTPVAAQVAPSVLGGQAMVAAAPEAAQAVSGPVAEAYAKFSKESLTRPGFDWLTALSLAACSHLAYAEPNGVHNICTDQWRLDAPQFVAAGSTQCFVAATDKVAIVAFRGTKGALDWFSNLNVVERRTSYGSVHDGFYNAFQLVRTRLESLLEPLVSTRAVVLTGHSLGGALATIAAAQWARKFPIAGIYTYGQPRVGFASFRSHTKTFFSDRFFRMVNADDIVPRVPPAYVHVGQLFKFNAAGRTVTEAVESETAVESPALSAMEFEMVKEQLRQAEMGSAVVESTQLEGLFPNYFSDHKLSEYMAKILKNIPR